MADDLYLTITLRKNVIDIPTGEALVDIVKAKLSDQPDVKVTANISKMIVDV